MNDQLTIKFDLEKWYTTSEVILLAKQGYAPFRSLSTLYKIINSGKLEVVARGKNTRKKYFIQGKSLVKYARSQQITINKYDGKQMQKSSTET